MTVCLVMIVRDEAERIGRCVASARPLIDSYCIVDTGSTDATLKVIADNLDGFDGEVHEREWCSFGENLTEALALARGKADWLLRLDADMTLAVHPDLTTWLASDPDPDTDAWMVGVEDHGGFYRLPLLVRGSLEWRYVGATHEYLDPMGRKSRSLLGLTVTHHADGNRSDKHERDLELLAAGVEAGDERAIFYSAEALRFLGRTEEAISLYQRRALLGGFAEEAWYAAYQAAKLAEDPEGLIEAWKLRRWRSEPLYAAAEIVARAEHDDSLFLERVSSEPVTMRA